MKSLSIIIPAWGCENYVMDCIKSVQKQTAVPGWNIEFHIGVDACEKTSQVLKKNKIKHYYSHRNVGHYVIRNILMALHKSDVYAYFDADDVMMPNYCRRTIEHIDISGFTMCAKINCDSNLRPRGKAVLENGGAMSFKHEIIEAVGGFRNYRCAADTDFMRRVEMAGYTITKIPEGLYYRRAHARALTKRADTGMGSPYRKKVWAEMTEMRQRGIIKIKPATVELERR